MTNTIPTNAMQRDYWQGNAGKRWAQWAERTDRALADVTDILLPAIAAKTGEVILDVGCGAGELSIALANQVGPDGRVYGVDISAPLLDVARSRESRAVRAPHWIEEDAQTAEWHRAHDAVVSRFGVMFFEDPAAAFTNLARALKPQGRLVFACWQGPQVNPFFKLLGGIARKLMPELPPFDPVAPGPMALADTERSQGLLAAAGFENISFIPHAIHHWASSGPDALAQALEYFMAIGPLAVVSNEGTPAQITAARAALTTELPAFLQGDRLGLPGQIWLVSARKG